ncbi:MAG: hypothetical protein KGS48_06315 [Bacteroidetes bacterium]|nr:hypothetical protein [Bacteroidota bacterium]
MNYNGEIIIQNIQNTGAQASEIGLLEARYVHYPDAQQLVVWLPQYGGKGYGQFRLFSQNALIESGPLRDRLNGSVQLLWDTLSFPDGFFRLEIEHPLGGLHLLEFVKLPEGVIPPLEKTPELQESGSEDSPKVYRDGAGNVLEDEDLKLRAQNLENLKTRFGRRVQYRSEGRSGTVIYTEGERCINLYYEFGGGDCVAWLNVPDADHWEAETGFLLSEREDIVQFIAETVRRDQASNCRIEITENSISFHR